MKNINIKELANELKLSVSTVSKVFHNSYEISEETKQRVMQTASRLNYVPNPYASSLRSRKTKNIAVVIPEVADSFFAQAINGVQSVAKEMGYHVLICLTHENFENEKAILHDFLCGRVDGLLMSVSAETIQRDHITDLVAKGLPLVFFDRACEEIETTGIITDDLESGYKATEHLIQQGCSKIAFMGISKNLSINNKRRDGYLQALNAYRIRIDEKYLLIGSNDAEQNYNLVKKLLKGKNRPDGIIASVEKLTTPIYKVCSDLKINIPKQLKVICFSNLETAAILNPSLTTITQPAFEMGKAAASILLRSLEKPNNVLVKEKIVIPSQLIIRDSTSN